MGQPRDRGRQRLAGRHVRLAVPAFLQLVQELEDTGAALRGVVEANVKVRDAFEPEPPAKLAPHEWHRPTERGDGCIAFRGLTDDAHPDLGVTQVGRGLNVRDRDEADPGIVDVPGHDPAISCRNSSSSWSVR